MRTYQFWQVDAFSAERYLGNPAAVVFDADTLSTEEMQRIARQMNLSETVFLCQPTDPAAHYRARIFTPRQELPFAGHPTVAASSSFYAFNPDTSGVLQQECGVGLVPVTVSNERDGDWFTLRAPAGATTPTSLGADDAALLLGLEPGSVVSPAEVCSIGARWLVFEVASLEALEAATPDQAAITRVGEEAGAVGLTVYARGARNPRCEVTVRTFAPAEGISEDPVCGSGNGSVAVHLSRNAWARKGGLSYHAEQGAAVSRAGVVRVATEETSAGLHVMVGGQTAVVMRGELYV